MNERLKELRKALKLTQQEFASRIHISRGALATYEVGRNEPLDAVISLICREFNVDEKWLRTGEGEMFIKAPNTALEELAVDFYLDPFDEALVDEYLHLTPNHRKAVRAFLYRVLTKAVGDKKLDELLKTEMGYPSLEEAVSISKALQEESISQYPSEAHRNREAVISKSETTTPVPDTTGQERPEPDIAAELAELKRQNRALAAKVAAMEEEDALLGLTAKSSVSPSASAGSFDPAEWAKK